MGRSNRPSASAAAAGETVAAPLEVAAHRFELLPAGAARHPRLVFKLREAFEGPPPLSVGERNSPLRLLALCPVERDSLACVLCASATGTNFGISNAPPTGNTIAPQVGLWWNPAESSSGHAIDLQHGVVVITIYSYNADGTPQWYLVSGPLINNPGRAPSTRVASAFRVGISRRFLTATMA